MGRHVWSPFDLIQQLEKDVEKVGEHLQGLGICIAARGSLKYSCCIY
uniref:Uncharacterized protein n=1 Tax=Arundo donax TaxID=35708 RepID=A0A0A9HKR6_ARUDO